MRTLVFKFNIRYTNAPKGVKKMLDQLAAHLSACASAAPVWGYILIFFFMAVESSFIPFPSEIVMIPAGFIAARGELTFGNPIIDLIAAIVIGVAGSLAGAYFNYALSAKLGEPFLRKYGKWFFLKPEALDRSEEIFRDYGAAATFTCRLIPVIRQLISIPAGLSGMPLKSFFLYTGLGAGIWSAILAGVGYALGKTAESMTYTELVHKGKDMVDAYLIWIVAGALLIGMLHIVIGKLVMGKKK